MEAVILRENHADSLPVITIADPRRVLSDRLYAEQVAEGLLEKLIAIDDFRARVEFTFPEHAHSTNRSCPICVAWAAWGANRLWEPGNYWPGGPPCYPEWSRERGPVSIEERRDAA